MSDETVLNQTHAKRALTKIEKAEQLLFGKVARRKKSGYLMTAAWWTRSVAKEENEKKRIDGLTNWLVKVEGMAVLKKTAMDRELWKKMIADVTQYGILLWR